MQPWEFDVGWLWVTILKSLGLAKVNRVAPQPIRIVGGQQPGADAPDFDASDPNVTDPDVTDPDVIYAVIRNRMHVLRAYAIQVVAPTVERELSSDSRRKMVRISRKLLTRNPAQLDAADRRRLHELLDAHPVLKAVHDCQEQLRQLWETVNPTQESLAGMFAGWCARAETSGIKALKEFAGSLRHLSSAAENGRTARKGRLFARS